MRKRRFSVEDDGPVPDHLRCRRSDGRHWRCPRRAMENISFCEYHYLLSRRNLAKNQSELRKVNRSSDPPPKKRRRKKVSYSEPLTEELIRMAIKRQMEKRRRNEKEMDVKRYLPNGVMAISSGPVKVLNNVGPIVDRKIGLGFDAVCFLRRCFRSKNVEPVPVGSIQKLFPDGKGLRRSGRRICCIKKCCKTCMRRGAEDSGCKKFASGNKFSRIRYARYFICQRLPVLKQLDGEQISELEIEAYNQGRRLSGVQLQVAEYSHNEQLKCNYCKISTVNFHRSCSKCSYKLCLSCCQEIREGSLPDGVAVVTCKCPNKRKAYKHVGETYNGMKKKLSSKVHSPLAPEWKAKNSDGNISCPPSELGGCGDGILNMKFLLPFGLTQKPDMRVMTSERLHDSWMKTLNNFRSTRIKGSM